MGKHLGMSEEFFNHPRPQFSKSRQVERREAFLFEARADARTKLRLRKERQLVVEKCQEDRPASSLMTVVRSNKPLKLKGARV